MGGLVASATHFGLLDESLRAVKPLPIAIVSEMAPDGALDRSY
jgi:hypothetical protein